MSQATSHFRVHAAVSARWVLLGMVAAALVAAAITQQHWLPPVQQFLSASATPASVAEPDDAHNHAGHDHAAHGDADSIKMSAQARKNIGLQVAKVELTSFTKSVGVPGMVVERPGRSVVEVTAPMTGIITKIYTIEGEAIEPGQKMFDLRLTHEELVQAQADLLQTAEEFDVASREIKRIEKLTADGALAGKQLLERQYESQKLTAVLHSKRQALLLHGLSDAQIDVILQTHELLKTLTVSAPATMDDGGMSPADAVFQVQSLKAAQGQHVIAGDTLAILADHAELYIEGEAFERDVAAISRAAEAKAGISAVWETEGGRPEVVGDLRILYLAAKVNPEMRTLDFYVKLPNELVRDAQLDGGHRYIAWRFRPGQRVQLQIPVETLPDRIVLPADAVAQDGAETYVFTPNGDQFQRRSVHVEHRDRQSAVIANDGSLFPGELVATSGAQQLQLAIKNKSGGAIDPHAGHHH
jgi:multidrug efflux pump subunit AcrA (membrane-fusion protein)